MAAFINSIDLGAVLAAAGSLCLLVIVIDLVMKGPVAAWRVIKKL